jgi:cytoskeletal protein CcmA (bactofilin family)
MIMKLLRVFSLTSLFLFSTCLSAQQAGEHVSVSGMIDDDLYLAGGQVDLYASVAGDVVVAGGQLNLEGNVRADVTAAGGDIELRGTVGDDARIVGGNLRVLAKINDDLVAAAGHLQVASTSDIGGSAWLAAGEVLVDGKIRDELHAQGGEVIITGSIGGNTEIWAEDIEIGSSAIILGNLRYKSPNPAIIADGARIEGTITHVPVETLAAPVIAGFLLGCVFILLSLVITSAVLYLVFPGVASACSKTISDKPWTSLGYGLAVFAAVPFVAVLLLSTGIGVFLALLLLAAYFVMLLLGYIAGAYYVAELGMRKFNKDKAGKTMHVISLGLALAVLFIVNIIPIFGSLLNWLVLLAGIGALKLQLVGAYMTGKVIENKEE